MRYTTTSLNDCWLIQPHFIADERGSFMEAYQQESFHEKIGSVHFIQDNEAQSNYGVTRGLHFQNSPFKTFLCLNFLSQKVLKREV